MLFEKNVFSDNFFSNNLLLPSRPLHCIKVICTDKLSEKIQNGQKWPFQFFSDNFSQKDWYKFRMAKNDHSEFFLTIFSQKDWCKFGMAKNVHSKFIQTFLIQNDWNKFGMAKFAK